MPAIVDVSHSVSLDAQSAKNARRVAHLKVHQFKTGDPNNPAKVNPRAHRQKGSRNAADIYLDALPIKARQWVKSNAPAVLIDARKLSIPDPVSDAAGPPVNLIVMVRTSDQMAALPRVLMAEPTPTPPTENAGA